MDTESVTVLSRLKAMLAASSPGMISRLACPASRELGKIRARMSSLMAASPCISPSTSRPGSRSSMSVRASRILAALAADDVPKLEWDNSATLGVIPKRRISSAARLVISAICTGVGS